MIGISCWPHYRRSYRRGHWSTVGQRRHNIDTGDIWRSLKYHAERNSYTLQKEQLTFHQFEKLQIRYWDVLNTIYQSVYIKYLCF